MDEKDKNDDLGKSVRIVQVLNFFESDLCSVLFYAQFLADCTATQYDRLLAAACCPSVCLSLCPSVCDAVHSGSQGWCTQLKVVPACS